MYLKMMKDRREKGMKAHPNIIKFFGLGHRPNTISLDLAIGSLLHLPREWFADSANNYCFPLSDVCIIPFYILCVIDQVFAIADRHHVWSGERRRIFGRDAYHSLRHQGRKHRSWQRRSSQDP